jgi:Ulp1 family protease
MIRTFLMIKIFSHERYYITNRAIRGVDIFDYQTALIPIFVDSCHWILGVIKNSRQLIDGDCRRQVIPQNTVWNVSTKTLRFY